LPSTHFRWHPDVEDPASKIATLNKRIEAYAAGAHYVFVDYYSVLKDSAGGLPARLSKDQVHPLPAAYTLMVPLAEAGIEAALKQRSE
jgi:lysophospholipase L1-like esterase